MTDMTTGSGRGWRSAFRVRMLHAQVRRRIANGKGRHNQYDEAEAGVPINQACVSSLASCTLVADSWAGRQRSACCTRSLHGCTDVVASTNRYQGYSTRGSGVPGLLAAYWVRLSSCHALSLELTPSLQLLPRHLAFAPSQSLRHDL